MRRRAFIAGIGGAVATWPASASAQPAKVPVIGYLGSISLTEGHEQIAGIRQGLSDAGFVEGQTVAVEYRAADGVYARLPALIAELANAKVDVIVAQGPPAARAARAANTTIPVVFGVGIDPVAEGLIASLARPGGTLTGVTMLIGDLMPKRLALLIDLAPEAQLIAVLVNPKVPNPWICSVEDLARAKGVRLLVLKASTPEEIDTAFAIMVQGRVEALIIGEDPFLALRPQIPEQALRHRIPTMGLLRGFAVAGGLATYGTNLKEAWRLVGTAAARVLKGAKPADLAVQQPTKFEMVLNLKTAKALGLTIPPLVLAQADEVIE